MTHEPAVAAGTDGDEARGLARRLAGSLPPEVRRVLLSALAEADALHESDHPTGHETARATACGTGCEPSSGAPELTLVPPCSRPGTLPAYQEPGPGRPAGHPESGDLGSRSASRNDPPHALIRLRFADAITLECAGAVFGAGAGPGLGDAWSDPETLTLQISGDAGVETLRTVLAVLDSATITPEALTVHTHELGDVFAAFTGLP
ncbi:hypothetical protein [Streptomyces sp. NWU339]|uniref:hypothetical protein n=1 Tax=Streptomyces sp. NWU339 TaxID=2185284 RepID=UPI0011B384B6|nr:hypothetical protein [Streptomyces sp. NWU339]